MPGKKVVVSPSTDTAWAADYFQHFLCLYSDCQHFVLHLLQNVILTISKSKQLLYEVLEMYLFFNGNHFEDYLKKWSCSYYQINSNVNGSIKGYHSFLVDAPSFCHLLGEGVGESLLRGLLLHLHLWLDWTFQVLLKKFLSHKEIKTFVLDFKLFYSPHSTRSKYTLGV